jgi:hypothetical protein
MNIEKEVNEFYFLVRKIIHSGILSEREASHLSIIFADWAMDKLPEKSYKPDILYDRLLKLINK